MVVVLEKNLLGGGGGEYGISLGEVMPMPMYLIPSIWKLCLVSA